MTTSPSILRQFARAYCQFVLRHFTFPGIDYWQIALLIAFLGFLGAIAFLAGGPRGGAVKRFCPPWLYCALLICALFITRLPTLLPAMFNPDEAMFLAGAMKLRHYPVFWQSLDGATSGPLNYYVPTLLNILGLPLDNATARLLNVICIGAAVAIVYCIARLFMADWTARLTPLPALAAAMAFRDPNFLHYSSECVPVLLIAGSFWLVFAEGLSNRGSRLRGFGIGFIAVLLPLAKLQAAPIAVTIAAAGVALAVFGRREHKWTRVLYICAGLAAGIASLLLFLLAFKIFGTFQQSYILLNLMQANWPPPVPLAKFLRYCLYPDIKWYEGGILAFLLYLFARLYFPWAHQDAYREVANRFIRTTVAAALLCYAVAWWFSTTPGPAWGPMLFSLLAGLIAGAIRAVWRYRAVALRLCLLDIVVILLLAASLYAVYRPRTEYPHYLLFLVFPLALVGARTLAWSLEVAKITGRAGADQRAVRAAGVFVLLTLTLPVFVRSKELRPPFASEARMAALPERLPCAACPLITRFANAGDPVTVWGWVPELYVMTGTIPATREPQTPYQLTMGGPMVDYFRRRFMEDLRLHPPKVFVDAVGPGQFAYRDRSLYGFETFPELREYVDSNFDLAGDVGGVRVFARRDAGSLKVAMPENTLRQ